jgi:hypothetical protein
LRVADQGLFALGKQLVRALAHRCEQPRPDVIRMLARAVVRWEGGPPEREAHGGLVLSSILEIFEEEEIVRLCWYRTSS